MKKLAVGSLTLLSCTLFSWAAYPSLNLDRSMINIFSNHNQIKSDLVTRRERSFEERAIEGIWSSSYNYPTSNGRAYHDGITEYFSNGRYNYKGRMRLTAEVAGTSLDTSYALSATGQWERHGDELVIVLTDLKSNPTTITTRTGVTRLEVPAASLKEFPKLESILPIGQSQRYQIKEIGNGVLNLEADDPFGNAFSIVNTRGRVPRTS